MDKHRIFELANQLRCAENSASIHHWFDELKKDISFEFSILGTFGEYSSLEPLCYGFSPTQFSTCFGHKKSENDPFVTAVLQSGRGIMALMDPY
ncbi:helix-turn-helix transcriptional regulator, partial [Vibrio cholerae]